MSDFHHPMTFLFCVCLVLLIFFWFPSLTAASSTETTDSFTIGDAEGIYSIAKVKEGPDGNIYIYDPRTAFISVFSPAGIRLLKMGGQGQGPGDIQRVTDLDFNFTYDKKYLYFTEFFGGHRWITFMELSGKFHHVLKLKVDKNFAIVSSIQLPDGRFLAHAAFPCDTAKREEYFIYRCPNALITIDNNGAIASEILRKSSIERISFISDGADIGIPYFPGYWWACGSGKEILFTQGIDKTIEIFDLKGNITASITADLPDACPVTAEDLNRWRKQRVDNARNKDWMARWGQVIKKYKSSVYPNKPVIMGMALTPEKNLLVIVRSGADNQPDHWEYRLLNRKGKCLFIFPGERENLQITPHFIFSKIEDEEGNRVLHVLKRKNGEKEKESLMRVSGK